MLDERVETLLEDLKTQVYALKIRDLRHLRQNPYKHGKAAKKMRRVSG
jgi:hypothetical protein